MKITLNNIPDCQCSRGCFISPGDKACAEAWGITEREAHSINTNVIDIISKSIMDSIESQRKS